VGRFRGVVPVASWDHDDSFAAMAAGVFTEMGYAVQLLHNPVEDATKQNYWLKISDSAGKVLDDSADIRRYPLECYLIKKRIPAAPSSISTRPAASGAGRDILRAALQSDAEETYTEPGEKTYPYEALKNSSSNFPKDVDPSKKEAYLSDVDFHKVFGMDFAKFCKMPQWKQIVAKKANGLF